MPAFTMGKSSRSIVN